MDDTILNDICIRDFKDLNISESMYYLLSFKSTPSYMKSFLKSFLHHKYIKEGNGEIAFLYSSSIGFRNDHFSAFGSLCSTSNNIRKIYFSKKRVIDFRAFFYYHKIFKWKKELIKQGINKKDAKTIGLLLYELVVECKYIDSFLKNIRSFISYCDVLPIDYFECYKLNKKNITTITIQHGFYEKIDKEYELSHSDIFISNSVLSTKYASRYPNIKKIITASPVSDLFAKERENIATSGVFAIILDVMHDNEETRMKNFTIIKLCETLAVNHSLKYIIRYHPADSDYFQEPFKNIESIQKNAVIPIDELISNVDFVVLNGSTCVFTAINVLTPFCKFKGSHGLNCEETKDNEFSNYEELESVYNKIANKSLTELKILKNAIIGENQGIASYEQILKHL